MSPAPLDPPPDAVPAPPPASIASNLPCVTCGYNLRTLDRSAVCPECRTPVAHSLRTSLWFSDRRWLRKVCNGLDLMLAATAALVVIVLLIYLMETQLDFEGPGRWLLRLGAYGIAFWAVVAWLGGAVLATTADPDRPGPWWYEWLAWAPVAVFMSPFLTVGFALLSLLKAPWDYFTSVQEALECMVVAGPAVLCPWIGPLILSLVLSALFARLPDPGRAARARWVFALQAVGSAGLALFVVLDMYLDATLRTPGGLRPTMPAFHPVLGWGSLALVVLAAIWKTALLVQLRRQLGRILAESAAVDADPRTGTRLSEL